MNECTSQSETNMGNYTRHTKDTKPILNTASIQSETHIWRPLISLSTRLRSPLMCCILVSMFVPWLCCILRARLLHEMNGRYFSIIIVKFLFSLLGFSCLYLDVWLEGSRPARNATQHGSTRGDKSQIPKPRKLSEADYHTLTHLTPQCTEMEK